VTQERATTRRTHVLDTGRQLAAARRRADSQRCRERVTAVIGQMLRQRVVLSDAEITRRAEVNPQ
jgi:hypothetical protein